MHILLVALFLLDTGPSASTLYARFNEFKQFDGYFSKYSKRYFGAAFDWRYFKAQAIAESQLQEDARSGAGAVGVMQVMPRTFDEIRQKNPSIRGPLEQPRWNIAAGISYDRQNYVVWKAPRPLVDKLKFMFGSYNAGRRNILNAQRLALSNGLDGTRWSSIETQLPAVTGTHNIETRNYITRIFEIKPVLE
jgi:membrane-bound lytic murein transglycosylase F